MDARAALATLSTWQATSTDDRKAVLDELAAAKGEGWTTGRTAVGRAGLGELVHAGTGLRFVVVPGGWLRMGASVDDLFTAARARDEVTPTAVFGGWATAMRPTRWVRMRPYLLAEAGLPPEGDQPTSDGGRASEAYRDAVDHARGDREDGPTADELVKAYEGGPPDEDAAEPAMRTVAIEDLAGVVPDGFRLPSEAELEWALREGGTTRWIGVAGDIEVTAANRRATLLGDLVNGFGLLGLRDLQNPCADGAVDYDVTSPTDQRARATDREQRIARWAHTYWQDDDQELLGVLACNRGAPDEYGETIVRLAADLPGLTDGTDDDGAGEPPAPLADHARALAALAGDDARAQTAALAALAHVGLGPGHDVAGTVSALLAALPTVAATARAAVLTWLADAQVGGHFHQTIERPERKRRHELHEDRADARAAVAAATDAIVPFLDDPDPAVRSAASLALAFTVDAPAEAKTALGKRLGREDDVGVQAGLILALVRLGAGFRAPAPDPVIMAAIAIATAFDGPPNVAALIAATAVGKVANLAFARGQLGNVAIGILRKQEPAVQAEAAAAIAARAAGEGERQLAELACEMAFGKPDRHALPRALEELSADQRRLVSALADFAPHLDWLGFGLPPTAAARRRYLGLDGPGPTDRFVTVGDAEVPLWFALRARLASESAEAATEAAGRLLASAPPAERLAIFLDRHVFELDECLAEPGLDALLAACDRAEARAVVDAVVATRSTVPRGPELVRAVAATRPGEELPEALLRELDEWATGGDLDALRPFAPAAVARHLNTVLQPHLEHALGRDSWSIGLDQKLTRWARVLELAPSPSATRKLLLLGWASGQPASVREAVGKAAAGHKTLGPVLAEYDALPQFSSWSQARAAMTTFAG